MHALTRTFQSISEGLIFGFTFAIGWLAAVFLVGALVA